MRCAMPSSACEEPPAFAGKPGLILDSLVVIYCLTHLGLCYSLDTSCGNTGSLNQKERVCGLGALPKVSQGRSHCHAATYGQKRKLFSVKNKQA